MKKYERITAVLTSLGGLWIMFYAWGTLKLGTIHVPDAGLVPFLCGVGLVILGIAWLVALKWTPEREEHEGKRLWRPIVSLLLMVVYGFLMEEIGYITSTLLFMIAWQQIVEREKWFKTIVIAILSTAGMYALFVYLLQVPIPKEFFM